jgi:hypothetical protein
MTRYPCLAALAALAMLGCTVESTSQPRAKVAPPAERDAAPDAEEAPIAPKPDPTGGRDDLAASCFAACQNTAFSCQAKSTSGTTVTAVDLTPDGTGCSGTITANGAASETALAFKLECASRTVCMGSAPGQPPTSCVQATFSAFTFGYTPGSGGSINLCTRN